MSDQFSRRNFLRTAALLGGVAAVAAPRILHAQDTTATDSATSPAMGVRPGGGEIIKVGIIGSGGRGSGAAEDCVKASPNVVITAIGDAFMDKCKKSLERLKGKLPAENLKVTEENLFDGFDCYKKVLAADVDLVILAAPPGFRPIHLRAAVEANKHIFCEKPVAVDPAGIRHVLESAQMITAKQLSAVAGTQRRHSKSYQETIKRIHDGAIGEVVAAQCYWMQDGLWHIDRTPEMSDMEWQMRNWLYFDWTSGDHIVEQHVHNIDVINWVMGGPPVKATASGGRQSRIEEIYGNVYDHFTVEYEYENGARVHSMCRQQEGATGRIGERIVGTKGTSDPNGKIEGANPFDFPQGSEPRDAYVQEHRDLLDSIRDGKHVNEIKTVAESNLTAMIGRMSAYTGQSIKFDWALKSSKLDLSPKSYEFGPHEINPVPMPGKTKLV